jgi:hypothetical protein
LRGSGELWLPKTSYMLRRLRFGGVLR